MWRDERHERSRFYVPREVGEDRELPETHVGTAGLPSPQRCCCHQRHGPNSGRCYVGFRCAVCRFPHERNSSSQPLGRATSRRSSASGRMLLGRTRRRCRGPILPVPSLRAEPAVHRGLLTGRGGITMTCACERCVSPSIPRAGRLSALSIEGGAACRLTHPRSEAHADDDAGT